jgi:hypothetical protein
MILRDMIILRNKYYNLNSTKGDIIDTYPDNNLDERITFKPLNPKPLIYRINTRVKEYTKIFGGPSYKIKV